MPRLCFISDTHEKHGKLTQAIIAARPDVLVHCGDLTEEGYFDALCKFAEWCSMLKRKEYIGDAVAIAGNHDLTLDGRQVGAATAETARSILTRAGIRYLEDSGTRVAGLRFWGSPWTPRFGEGWCFQINDDAEDERIFARVPKCDVLITHGPPYGIRDIGPTGKSVGSVGLRMALDRAEPRVHAFGHVHRGAGITFAGGTLYVNAASCDEQQRAVNPPVIIDLEPKGG